MNQKTDQEAALQLAEQVAKGMWSRDNTPQLPWNGPVIDNNKGEQI